VAIVKPALTKPIPAPNIIIDLGNILYVKPDSSKKQEISIILIAIMKPKNNKNVLLSTLENDTPASDLVQLDDILDRFRNTTNLLKN
jgi:hypothetical protein